ncbi:MAG: Superoxide dismutase [Candidatus Gottesmanbacteria bacterium GW2011_GWA1_43_11]|uniref:Superoxide dismutase n=1 Tax=Candidatus Gottesmanbacteria bacterium GW2011_GWA1_43_11 TaxID=1618436 RepID=A0A0G1CK34_9BACT|nr:MAG: Superoxide dismutase [Candidatus Gottesmanbacteria bacterium GW2011_GWA1_43_11]
MFTLSNLPYAYNALEPYIDEATMKLHHDKHHAAYVKNLNDALVGHDKFLQMSVEMLLQKLSAVPESVRTKVRNNAGGHANHGLFWQLLAPKKDGVPRGEIAKAITETFGDFKSFQEKFTAAALGRFGSGWAWLVSENGKLVITDTANQDTPLIDNKIPVLGLDVWEHAYYLKYQNRRVDYIAAWWYIVNWEEVDRRFLETI